MLLATIGTDRQLHSRIDQAKIAWVRSHLDPFINEIEIDLNATAQSSVSQLNNSLNAGMRRGCG